MRPPLHATCAASNGIHVPSEAIAEALLFIAISVATAGCSPDGAASQKARSNSAVSASPAASIANQDGAANKKDALTYVEQHLTKLDRGGPARKIEDFKLADFSGQEHSLASYADKPAIVLVFLGTQCPLARLYAPKIQALADKYAAKGVVFLAVDSNVQDSISELRDFAISHELKLPLLRDVDNQLADRCGATRTPEAVLLDSEHVVRYQGRIDDEFGFYEGTSYQRVRKVRNHLVAALEELLANKPIAQPCVPAPGCLIGRARPRKTNGSVTWCRDIAPIVQRRCQTCHRPGTTAPFSLLTYDDARGWEEMMLEVVSAGRMPPWHANPKYGKFINDPRLSDPEKAMIAAWVKSGAPEGDPRDLPPPKQFRDQWRMSDPDLVLYIAEQPVDIPAAGLPLFKERLLDLNFKVDTWLDAIQCQPDNKAVVHHMDVLVAPAGDFNEHLRAGRVQRMGGYVPGIESTLTGLAGGTEGQPDKTRQPRILIPAGSQLLIDMHYKPNGRPQKDRSAVALRFAPPPGEEPPTAAGVESDAPPSGATELAVGEQSILIEDTEFCIPPGVAEHKVTATYTFMHPATLNALHAHMHVRGKSMLYEAFYPDGTDEILLDVPRYDYNWELVYALAEPKQIPRGTRMRVTTIFDNSVNNPHNPDPEVPVFYGRGYYDQEMMAGTMSFQPHITGFTTEAVQLLEDRTRQQPIPKEIADQLLAAYLKPTDAAPSRMQRYYYRRGQFRQDLGDLIGAVADFSQSVNADPGFANAYLARAKARVKLGQLVAARADFDEAIRLNPRETAAYIGRGTIAANLNTALSDFNHVLSADPHNADALFHRGEALHEAGDFNRALADYTQLIDTIHPGYMEAHLRRAALLFDIGRETEARQQFKNIEQLRPTYKTNVDYYLGACLTKKRYFEEALPHLEQYLAIVPESASALQMYARATLELGRYADCEQSLQRLNQLLPKDAHAWQMLGILKGRQAEAAQDTQQRERLCGVAIKNLKHAIKLAPDDASIAISLGEAYQVQGQVKNAIVVYREILRVQPDNTTAAIKLSWLLTTASDPALRDGREAVLLAERACRATQMRDPNYIGALAAALAESGRFDDALVTVTKALKLAYATNNSDLVAILDRQRERYESGHGIAEHTIGPVALP